MPQPLADYLRVHVARQQVRCMSVTKIVEGDRRQLLVRDELIPGVREGPRPPWPFKRKKAGRAKAD